MIFLINIQMQHKSQISIEHKSKRSAKGYCAWLIVKINDSFFTDELRHAHKMLGHLIDISVFVINFERQSQKSNNNSTNKKKMVQKCCTENNCSVSFVCHFICPCAWRSSWFMKCISCRVTCKTKRIQFTFQLHFDRERARVRVHFEPMVSVGWLLAHAQRLL